MQVDLVQKECGRYFDNYTACVNRFPHTWHLDCLKQKVKLAKCAQSNPVIMKIKNECSESFAKYEDCVGVNQTNMASCSKEFETFSKCAQQFQSWLVAMLKEMSQM